MIAFREGWGDITIRSQQVWWDVEAGARAAGVDPAALEFRP
jgi:hypothetical protein